MSAHPEQSNGPYWCVLCLYGETPISIVGPYADRESAEEARARGFTDTASLPNSHMRYEVQPMTTPYEAELRSK